MNNWNTVFDAHPQVPEIFIGTDKNGNEQPFLEKHLALNFAGGDESKVRPVRRDAGQGDKSPGKSEALATPTAPQKGSIKANEAGN